METFEHTFSNYIVYYKELIKVKVKLLYVGTCEKRYGCLLSLLGM